MNVSDKMPEIVKNLPQKTNLPFGKKDNAILVLADGTIYHGQGFGSFGTIFGELCFNTSQTGYQEILSDPSYTGQIIIFTFPHVGNVGVNENDLESEAVEVSGLILAETPSEPSNYRSEKSLVDWLKDNSVTGISGIDTRALTRRLRKQGVCNAAICYSEKEADIDVNFIIAELDNMPDMKGLELASKVMINENKPWKFHGGDWRNSKNDEKLPKPRFKVAVLDFGYKLNILRELRKRGCEIMIFPGNAPSQEILAIKPDGILVCNGPGDPTATSKNLKGNILNLIKAKIPMFGICMGHQLLAISLGAEVEKMHQGHRGGNHPVKNEDSGVIEITSQNHGFVVSHSGLPSNIKVTHTSLFDGTVEGIESLEYPVFSVQHHPESSPGPHDSKYLFDKFIRLIEDPSILGSDIEQSDVKQAEKTETIQKKATKITKKKANMRRKASGEN